MRVISIITCCCIALLWSLPAAAECAGETKEIAAGSASATASMLANSMNRKGSINAESGQLINEALTKLQSPPPADLCPSGCQPATPGKLRFTSVPQLFLQDYSDQEKCAAYLKQTTAAPLRFPTQRFPDRDAMMEWISSFSQGKGDEGKKLYQQCDGSCSPRYSYDIEQQPNGQFLLTPQAICGPARDKSDDMYALRTVLLYTCSTKQ